MGVIFNIGDKMEQEQLGKMITFGMLNFIADRFGDLCLQESKPTKEGEQSLQLCAFAAGLEEVVDTGPDVLVVYLKCDAHLFVEDGQEGEIVHTFRISKTSDRGVQRCPMVGHSRRLWWNPLNLLRRNTSRRR